LSQCVVKAVFCFLSFTSSFFSTQHQTHTRESIQNAKGQWHVRFHSFFFCQSVSKAAIQQAQSTLSLLVRSVYFFSLCASHSFLFAITISKRIDLLFLFLWICISSSYTFVNWICKIKTYMASFLSNHSFERHTKNLPLTRWFELLSPFLLEFEHGLYYMDVIRQKKRNICCCCLYWKS
jgi:hypothetical protein